MRHKIVCEQCHLIAPFYEEHFKIYCVILIVIIIFLINEQINYSEVGSDG